MKIFFLLTFFSALVHAQVFEMSSNSFKDLYNQYRVAQPKTTPWAGSFFPYGEKGTAVKVRGISPMETYDKLTGLSGQNENAYQWEVQNHSCDHLTGEDKESCESWWGHCNGWTAAAIKEMEPITSQKVGNLNLTVADMKGIYSELWLSSNSLFEGETNKTKKTGPWVMDNSYEAKSFWDVTPRSFFTIFTNYIGIHKTGIAIDRFAGDEVWNQPVVGYRILPIRQQDLRNDGKIALIRMKIYWANDLGTSPGHITAKFDINKNTRDIEGIEALPHSNSNETDFEGRLLRFWLEFDQPLQMSADGKQVINAGNIVSDGIWNHYLEAKQAGANYDWLSLNETHPDFIWLPTSPMHDNYSGYGNPFLEEKNVEAIRSGQGPRQPNPNNPDPNAQGPNTITIKFKLDNFQFRNDYTPESVRDAVRRLLARDSMRANILIDNVKVTNTSATITMTMVNGESADAVRTLFEDAGHTVISAVDVH